jgi:hypothetical protein
MPRGSLKQIQDRIAKKEASRKAADAEIRRLRKLLGRSTRRAEDFRKYLLGAAVMSWAASNERVLAAFRGFLSGYLSRPVDFSALRGTPYEVAARAATPAATGQEAAHG